MASLVARIFYTSSHWALGFHRRNLSHLVVYDGLRLDSILKQAQLWVSHLVHEGQLRPGASASFGACPQQNDSLSCGPRA